MSDDGVAAYIFSDVVTSFGIELRKLGGSIEHHMAITAREVNIHCRNLSVEERVGKCHHFVQVSFIISFGSDASHDNFGTVLLTFKVERVVAEFHEVELIVTTVSVALLVAFGARNIFWGSEEVENGVVRVEREHRTVVGKDSPH